MPPNLKIAYLSTQFYEVKSGPGRFSGYLREFPFREIEFHFFADQIKEAQPRYWPVYKNDFLSKLPLYYFIRAYYLFKSVSKAHKYEKFDAWFCSSYVEALFLLFYKPDVPVYVCVNDYNALLIWHQWRKKIQKIGLRKFLARLNTRVFEYMVCHNADKVVANSKFNQALIIKHYGVPTSKCLLLYKVVDLSFFKPDDNSRIPPRKFLFVKNDFMRGGLDVIMQALSSLPWKHEIALTVAGISETHQAEVKNMAEKNGLEKQVTILGLIDKDTLRKLYTSHDVFISMAREEALGVACMEAMASGLPVIATQVGGLPEVLDEGRAGFMIEPDNANALVRLLESLEENHAQITQKAQYALEHCKKFSYEHLEKNLLVLFQELQSQKSLQNQK